MLISIFGSGAPRRSRSDRIDAMSGDIDRASERQALASLYVSEAADRASATAHATIVAARNAAALVRGKR